MEAISELERLGYQFILNGSAVYYVHKGDKPDPREVQPLLDSLRRHRAATVSFLRERAAREAHDRALVEAEAAALLDRAGAMDELEWCQRWAEVMTRLGAPCTTNTSWAAWLAEVVAETKSETEPRPVSAII
jgi:hypothetical protein